MLRIYFTSDDVARTRITSAPDPLWELALSLHMLQNTHGEPVFGQWRRTVRDGLRTSQLGRRMRLLLALNPPRGYFADFLTPTTGEWDVRDALEAVRSTPAATLRGDLTVLAGEVDLPAEAGPLAHGEVSAVRHLTGAMADYYQLAIEPYWRGVRAAVDRDHAARTRAMLDGGTERLLGTLRPGVRWTGGELQVDYPVDQELYLDGRGLVLQPSYFCWRQPVTLLDPSRPPVLVYPVERGTELVDGAGGTDGNALAALLGRTRAAVLAQVRTGATTGELARRLYISPAAASQHIAVLRNSGLVTSRRDGNRVLHMLTPLGVAMLSGG
ncbi:MAG TPA: helix-turn-helix domain-containing protein [Micromonosporaceae bacterium]